LLGFRGKGYSDGFVVRMTEVQDALVVDPRRRVRLLDVPDTLCDACPNLRGGCTLGGPAHEAHMRAQDREVLDRLGFRAGDEPAWEEVLRRVSERVRGSDLPALCTTCPWLPLGWCAEGIDALRGAPPRGGP
jgi:hypothetical protein